MKSKQMLLGSSLAIYLLTMMTIRMLPTSPDRQALDPALVLVLGILFGVVSTIAVGAFYAVYKEYEKKQMNKIHSLQGEFCKSKKDRIRFFQDELDELYDWSKDEEIGGK
jgi:hypothetical protein